MIPCGTLVPVAVWQPCELLYTCYLLTHFEPLHLCYYAVRRGNDHIRFRSVGRRNSVIAKFHYTDTDADFFAATLRWVRAGPFGSVSASV